ncbi:hypothetical protein B0H10DRAFT_2221941 [Mycena sp. CBHHK59/15]|nr:hypothetical protein B0H10DRAFT_2221941 [Mycena sp. CBHHK59/15]
MAQLSPKKPHPHSVDLLRNRSPVSPLGPFDGTVAAHAQIGVQHFYITTNTDYVPTVPLLEIPHKVFLRTDMRYGTDDPTLWPQQFTVFYCHLPLISRKGARPELDIMWWNPGPQDFHVGSALTWGLGRLALKRFSPFLPPATDIVARCRELRRKSPALAIPLFGQLIQQLLMLLEKLQMLPTTYTKMLFTVTSLQRAFLELDALYIYMTVYKERIDNYLAAPADVTRPGQFVGAFTAVPSVAQQLFGAGIPFWFIRGYEVFDQENILSVVPLTQPNFDLPDPDAHAKGAPPALYTGNSTSEKIAAIQRAARQTPWYTDPFELKLTRTSDAAPTDGGSVVVVGKINSMGIRGRRKGGQGTTKTRCSAAYVGYPRTILAAPPPTRPRKLHIASVPSLDKPSPAYCIVLLHHTVRS